MGETVASWLESKGAHHDVVEWARPFGDAWERLWSECPRGDWMLGIAARGGVARADLVRAASACARLALDQVPDGEARPAEAIARAEAYARGEDDADARAEATEAVEAAIDGAPDAATAAAAMAALAALRTIESAADAPLAAASAVQAAVLDAGDCAMMSALGFAQHACAERVREAIPFASLNITAR